MIGLKGSFKLDLALSAVAPTGVVMTILAEIIYRWPVNHVAYDIKWLLLFCALSFVIAVKHALGDVPTHKRLSCLFIAGVAILALILVIIADRCNFMVAYEAWLKRGMPSSGKCIF